MNENFATDVVIVGGGISGIAAAKTLKKNKLNYHILEASHRIGGRAYTEVFSSNNFFDLGCSYLHNGDRNPFLAIAKSLGIPINTKNGDLFKASKINYFSNGQKKSFNGYHPIEQANHMIVEQIQSITRDKAVLDFMDPTDHYFPVLCHLYSTLNASDPDLLSAIDYRNSIYQGPDYPIPYGFGNLIKAWSIGININLNTTVRKIYWKKGFVTIETNRGTFYAKKLIITVSTSILQNNSFEIVPEFPKDKITAVENLPMGVLNKIGIELEKLYFSKIDKGFYVNWPDKHNIKEEEVCSFEVNTSGANNIVVFVGGRFGKWLEERGSNAMEEYAISTIEDTFGSSIKNKVRKIITTAWSSDPFTRGSYSYALPSDEQHRKILSQNIENTIFFAGEATDSVHYGTAHGAYFSGVRAANEVMSQEMCPNILNTI